MRFVALSQRGGLCQRESPGLHTPLGRGPSPRRRSRPPGRSCVTVHKAMAGSGGGGGGGSCDPRTCDVRGIALRKGSPSWRVRTWSHTPRPPPSFWGRGGGAGERAYRAVPRAPPPRDTWALQRRRAAAGGRPWRWRLGRRRTCQTVWAPWTPRPEEGHAAEGVCPGRPPKKCVPQDMAVGLTGEGGGGGAIGAGPVPQRTAGQVYHHPSAAGFTAIPIVLRSSKVQ